MSAASRPGGSRGLLGVPSTGFTFARFSLCMRRPIASIISDYSALRHRIHREDVVESRWVDQAALDDELADRPAGLHRLLRNVRRGGVADVRTERGGARGAPLEQIARARPVGGDAVDATQ